ncbi:hypothetical protein Tam10B_1857 [Bifidobacterium vansinderenii]|uniref:PhnA protein n=2 Tax=Bifidobacterium vansinderenii TaxID=1984871 RepID=A0A229VW97_9BIFI|nr:hypothetical protein Tam10B_1857 [Bifidobacterium vansinderenii]
MSCQHCGTPVTPPWTLCPTCRKQYARTLHQLSQTMLRLQAIAHHDYKITEGHGTTDGFAPIPVNMTAIDMLDDAEQLLQDMLNETGIESRPRWQRILRWIPKHIPDLCKASRAGHYLEACASTLLRIQPITDRIPRKQHLIGQCPHCNRPINAAPKDEWKICKCGHLLDLTIIRHDSRQLVNRLHKTMTPAECSKWLQDEYGLKVNRKTISTWINRGQLPSSKRVEDGYWEFNVHEILTLAESLQTKGESTP